MVIVARITQIRQENMRTILEVNDTTGATKVVFYMKGEGETPHALKDFNQRENIYVKIYGTVRIFKEERAVVGSHVEEVVKHDEITNHLLQAFVAQSMRTKGALATADIKAGAARGAKGPAKAAGDYSQIIMDMMREVTKDSRFADRSDLWTIC